MGKNKRRQIDFFDSFHNIKMSCDSHEEIDFTRWCIEAQKLGIVKDWEYQPESIKLFDTVDYINADGKKRCLFREHVYSPDFILKFDPRKCKKLCLELKVPYDKSILNECSVYLDVKGTFNRNQRDFGNTQKWVFQKTGIYVCKVIPKDFFKTMGCPLESFITEKTKKARKMFSGYSSIKQALNLI